MRNGKEEGFSLSYWKLSYRRKFKRTLVMMPVVLLCVVFYFSVLPAETAWLLTGVVILACGLQLWYNYHKMKQIEREQALEETAKHAIPQQDTPDD